MHRVGVKYSRLAPFCLSTIITAVIKMLIIAAMCIVQHPSAPEAEAKSLAVLKLKIFIIFVFISDPTYH